MYTNIEYAIKVATDAHEGQKDKGGKPGILHPLAVMLKCKTEEEMIVAVLHDAIEDTTVTATYLYNLGFDDIIVEAVIAISKQKDEEYFDYINRCKKNKLAKIVKLHDLDHNMSSERQGRLPKEQSISLMKRYTKALRILME